MRLYNNKVIIQKSLYDSLVVKALSGPYGRIKLNGAH